MRVLIAESRDFSREALDTLRAVADVETRDILDRESLVDQLRDADVLWVRLRHHVDKEALDAAPSLRLIVSPTTGLNHIDLEESERRGIRVLSLRGETDFLKTVRATAELTLALTLALMRRIPAAVGQVHDGLWDRGRVKGRELYDKTLWIIGYGRLGQIVADYFKAFGAHVLAHDTAPMTAEPGITLVPLETLLERSDIVSLHVSYRPENRELIDAQHFGTMRKGSWFINTARGELVDEHALLSALESGHLAGAAVDVLQDEQQLTPEERRKHVLVRYAREHENLVITPHIGGCTHESMANTELFMAKKVAVWIESTCQVS